MSRKKVESVIYSRLDELDPSGINSKIYKALFKNMSNSDFEDMMIDIRDGKYGISITAPNADPDVKLDLARNKKIMKARNIPLFRTLTITNGETTYKPNNKFMVMNLPIARLSQTVSKKFSAHVNINTRNKLTGQVTADSKSGELSINEINILKSLNLTDTLAEFIGIRGGDVKGSIAFKTKLFKDGVVTKEQLKQFTSKRISTVTLHSFFKAIHININI